MGGGKYFGDDTMGTMADKKHYATDWESNIDGHLMYATDKFLANDKADYEGFKAYMRMVFGRPFVEDRQARDWFEGLEGKIKRNLQVREEVLLDLFSELRAELKI